MFLSKEGQVKIVNEKDGQWVNEVWFSNDYYKEKRKPEIEWPEWNYFSDCYKKKDTPIVHVITPAKRSPSFECHICKVPQKLIDLHNVVVKLPNGLRYHRFDICPTCYTLFNTVNKFEKIVSQQECCLCHLPINKKEDTYRRDFLCITMHKDNTRSAKLMCSACTFTQFRTGFPTYTTGYVGWLINENTFEFFSY